ncbi:unnamed protein product [Haemonchus placei]|uniref:GIT domain-containing protein n=1 Tax=Haemonchus placei TaxID=6290 RepID=A0A0N4VUX0_HAEPC|nr:unnamed protein product [Haemonchus placei]
MNLLGIIREYWALISFIGIRQACTFDSKSSNIYRYTIIRHYQTRTGYLFCCKFDTVKLPLRASAIRVEFVSTGRAVDKRGFSPLTGSALILSTPLSISFAIFRSHSAGADANLIIELPSSSDMRAFNLMSARDATGNSNVKFLRATKRFFKKIYSTATLPNKKSQEAESQLQKSQQFFDIGFHTPALTDERDFSRIEEFHNYGQTYIDTCYPDSGLDMDRSSTPDQSMGSMTVTVTSSESGREDRCDDLFETLRREMHAMRARDAAILADLHRVESQIQSVKLARLGIYGASPQPVQSLPI